MKYYLEVIKEGLSICLDYDINLYHHYQIGDIIKINFKLNDHQSSFSTTLESIGDNWSIKYDAFTLESIGDNWSIKYDAFTIDWGKVNQKRLSIASCLNSKYITDITIKIERQDKLNKILNNDTDSEKKYL